LGNDVSDGLDDNQIYLFFAFFEEQQELGEPNCKS
jgi:hypothetical protein